MNKITHEGKDYEVLPLDRISEITHAKLAGGKVVEIVNDEDDSFEIRLSDNSDFYLCKVSFADFGIQPLKLLPKAPLEFVATAEPGTSFSYIQAPFDCANKTFKCVEVTE